MSEMFYWTQVEPGGDYGLGKVTSAWPCPGSISSLKGATDMPEHTEGHAGVDIAAPSGTPVYAPCDALVRDVFVDSRRGTIWDGFKDIFGNSVILEHDGYVSLYGHLRDTPSVTELTTIRRGALLGYVGSTGTSTGPHLHWGLAPARKADGQPSYLPRAETLDPLAFCRLPAPAALPGGEFLPEPDESDAVAFYRAAMLGPQPDSEIVAIPPEREGWTYWKFGVKQ